MLNFDGADTIVFRKPKLFGIWWDVFRFLNDQFWRVFGGQVATFTSFRD